MGREHQWIVGRDVGVSSKTIWSVFMDVKPDWADVPYDPDDFGRCFRLLLLAPSYWRRNLKLVALRYPEWAPLVREWDALSKFYLEEPPSGTCPKLYARMRELIDEGRLLAGWKRTSPCSWQGPQRGHRVPVEAIEQALAQPTTEPSTGDVPSE